MESVCVEQEIDCEVRNKYENKIIKKHFINSAKSNKNKRPKKKISTNSGKLTAFRHHENLRSNHSNFAHFKRRKETKRVSEYFNNESTKVLSNSDENVCAELKDDVSMMSNMNGWQCDSCTFLNVEWTLCCEMCNKYNPLCLSLNNITIQEYVNIDVYDNNNNPNLHAEIEDYEILNDSDFDGDDFNDNLQYILIEAVNNNDEKENKNNDDNDNDNGNNVDFVMTHGHFNSYLSVEQKEDGFMIVSYQHINNEKK